MSTHRVTTASTSTKKATTAKRAVTAARKTSAAKSAPQTKLLKELRVDLDALYDRVERLRHRVA